MQSLKPDERYPIFECNHTLKEFTTRFKGIGSEENMENESVKLAGKPQVIKPRYHACTMHNLYMHDNQKGRLQNKREESRKLIIYEIRHLDGDKVQLIVDKKYITKISSLLSYHVYNMINFEIYSSCKDDLERVPTDIKVGDIIGVEGFPS